MHDAIDTRLWADNHEQLGRNLGTLFAAVRAGLEKLHTIQWSAPWRSERRRLWADGAPQA
jgi:hypothetical protein